MPRRITVPRSRSFMPAVLAAALFLACGDPRPAVPIYSGPAQETPAALMLPARGPAAAWLTSQRRSPVRPSP